MNWYVRSWRWDRRRAEPSRSSFPTRPSRSSSAWGDVVTEYAFPYREEGNPKILGPTFDLRVQLAPHGDWTFRALVDSGAPISFVDRGVGEALGVRFKQSGARRGSLTVLGGTWPTQVVTVDFEVPGCPGLMWTGDVAVVDDPALQIPFQGVLGHDGFLDKYAVTFNSYDNYFVVVPADEWHERYGRRVVN